jgi:hypothetical protein
MHLAADGGAAHASQAAREGTSVRMHRRTFVCSACRAAAGASSLLAFGATAGEGNQHELGAGVYVGSKRSMHSEHMLLLR